MENRILVLLQGLHHLPPPSFPLEYVKKKEEKNSTFWKSSEITINHGNMVDPNWMMVLIVSVEGHFYDSMMHPHYPYGSSGKTTTTKRGTIIWSIEDPTI